MKGVVLLFGFWGLPNLCASFFSGYPGKSSTVSFIGKGDPGEPLFLTPYIEKNLISEGREAAVVPPMLNGVLSYAGYLTVNKKFDSNMFFWFFPAQNKPESSPVTLWLQGGPGASSLFATFTENGPFQLINRQRVRRAKYSWTRNMNVLYIDNPVGTGFSFTKNESGYATNEDQVGSDLYSALYQFFQLFDEFSKNDFLITGESYAGKYVPALGYTIHKMNPTAKRQINLKGLAIGNGWVDPLEMIDYAQYLYGLSFIDLKTKQKFTLIENKIKNMIRSGKYRQAFTALDNYIDGDLTGDGSLIINVTGINSYYNFLRGHQTDPDEEYKMLAFLNEPVTRKKLHVGNKTFNEGNQKVEEYLENDSVISIVPKLQVLLNNYRILLYNGQLDIICAYPLMMNYVRKLNWSGATHYAAADRKQWYVGNGLAGYVKTSGQFSEVLVRNAGHMVPTDQPRYAFDMITNFAYDLPFNCTG